MKRKRGLPTYPGSRTLYAVLSVLIILESMTIIAQAYFLARAITLLFERVPLIEVFIYIVYFFTAFVLRYVITHVQTYLAENHAEKTGRMLRENLLQAYFYSHSRFVQQEGTGQLVNLAIEGVDDIKRYLEIIAIRTFKTVIIPIAIVIYVATHDFTSAIIMVVTVPIVIFFMILLGYAAQKMADNQYETYRMLANHFIDSLKGLETLKYLGQSMNHAKKIQRVSHEYRKATMKTLRVAFLSSFALDFFTSLSIAFVAVSLGFRLIDGEIFLLPALTILILAPEYFSPIKQVGKDYHATLDGQIAMEEIEAIIKEREQTFEKDEMFHWEQTSTLQLENVDVAYDDANVLQDISFSWKGSGMIGVIGASGSGKSTFINLLAGRINPNNGEILVNDKIVNTLNNPQWFENIAYIPQHPYIFPASLADNIRFYVPSATDEDVIRVIQQIELETFVAELPDGIHEKIGEGGRTLSGGQEQRVAMARALLSKKPIILLDEPTAHLDIETEYEIKQVMLRLFKNKLVFLATHRLHWMPHMDHLLVLNNGRIVEQGNHNQLQRKNSMYVNLRRGQQGGLRHGKLD